MTSSSPAGPTNPIIAPSGPAVSALASIAAEGPSGISPAAQAPGAAAAVVTNTTATTAIRPHVPVGSARSAFAARFTAVVGEPAPAYVTRRPMHLALERLREDGAGVADRLGYRSEAAFSRAFKRVVGVSPGAARRGELTPR